MIVLIYLQLTQNDGDATTWRFYVAMFNTETKNGEDMSKYSSLLGRAVTAIAAQFERKNAGNLFAGRGDKLTDAGKQVKSAGDFELITWLVIK